MDRELEGLIYGWVGVIGGILVVGAASIDATPLWALLIGGAYIVGGLVWLTHLFIKYRWRPLKAFLTSWGRNDEE